MYHRIYVIYTYNSTLFSDNFLYLSTSSHSRITSIMKIHVMGKNINIFFIKTFISCSYHISPQLLHGTAYHSGVPCFHPLFDRGGVHPDLAITTYSKSTLKSYRNFIKIIKLVTLFFYIHRRNVLQYLILFVCFI